jgi:ring-1,2-phenylacetyl-CoA epoxidase subunit PaaE
MNTYTLKVLEVRREAEDSVTICFKQPALRKVRYKAGQYLTLIFRINGRRYIRPYSFSSSPEIDPLIEITVKRIFNGIVSNHINDFVKEGDIIEALSPLGEFCHNSESGIKNIYLWGAGSGITPLFSILKSILSNESDAIVHLIYGNRNEASAMFISKLDQLQQKYPKRLFVRKFYTSHVVNIANSNQHQGRINQAKAESILLEDNLIMQSVHYICGPTGLKDSVKLALKTLGIPQMNIYSEDFELVKNPEDFVNIQNQVIRLKYKGQVREIEVTKGKSVLDAALDSDIELPYSCQTGSCSTCTGKLLSGKAVMIGLSKSRDDLAIDTYLLCCTHPLSEEVYFEV